MEDALQPGSWLPPSRQLAKEIGLSRNTVIAAYEQLIEEGLLESKHGSGTRVSNDLLPVQEEMHAKKTDMVTTASLSSRVAELPPVPASVTLFGGSTLLAGFPDLDRFPSKAWNQAFLNASNRLSIHLRELDVYAGSIPLRKELAQYLRVSRGVKASHEQVFITAGASQSLHLVSRALTNVGDVAWLEDPGYSVAKLALQLADLNIKPIRVDERGASLKNLPAVSPNLIYLTTSYQFPLGYTMPLERRTEWLELARQHNAWIIEDDYDGEFRYSGNPVPALAGLEGNQQTLYMGTFSKTLSPSLRMSYLVVPPNLVDTFRKAYPVLGNESSVVTQAALAELIGGGTFFRHVKNMRDLYGSRRLAMEDSLSKTLGLDTQYIQNKNAGLHITVSLDVADRLITEKTVAQGLGCTPISSCFHSYPQQNGLMLGFTSRNQEINARALEVLADVLEESGANAQELASD
ncbi:PLP-dependent aminotransferase family protein [Pseudoteredinibacter isoporae]|uniref:GntR family transcriptional regulator/MocR family aminotransferase n=1 Tax=Pseudoteredinibacter isoporae TaxID=570281 RepID=A0A7X0JSY2_9GAMM|nr:GntR family transcriptional regulator/MocR family aminotransferase [Pseudoteredinibacter isoporae]NHO86837.1 PLP-dependent aminotransferase family protein [Pseudoteredinibacter isoporae]NIB24711.1 PLP-dependent aminotransferase family protein [Pseudoteredinibacter isoporae]